MTSMHVLHCIPLRLIVKRALWKTSLAQQVILSLNKLIIIIIIDGKITNLYLPTLEINNCLQGKKKVHSKVKVK